MHNAIIHSPSENPLPLQQPKVFETYFDPEILKKVATTIRKKVGAYLKKAGVMQWWESWLEEAKKNVIPSQPQRMKGIHLNYMHPNIEVYTLLYIDSWILNALHPHQITNKAQPNTAGCLVLS